VDLQYNWVGKPKVFKSSWRIASKQLNCPLTIIPLTRAGGAAKPWEYTCLVLRLPSLITTSFVRSRGQNTRGIIPRTGRGWTATHYDMFHLPESEGTRDLLYRKAQYRGHRKHSIFGGFESTIRGVNVLLVFVKEHAGQDLKRIIPAYAG